MAELRGLASLGLVLAVAASRVVALPAAACRLVPAMAVLPDPKSHSIYTFCICRAGSSRIFLGRAACIFRVSTFNAAARSRPLPSGTVH